MVAPSVLNIPCIKTAHRTGIPTNKYSVNIITMPYHHCSAFTPHSASPLFDLTHVSKSFRHLSQISQILPLDEIRKFSTFLMYVGIVFVSFPQISHTVFVILYHLSYLRFYLLSNSPSYNSPPKYSSLPPF